MNKLQHHNYVRQLSLGLSTATTAATTSILKHNRTDRQTDMKYTFTKSKLNEFYKTENSTSQRLNTTITIKKICNIIGTLCCFVRWTCSLKLGRMAQVGRLNRMMRLNNFMLNNSISSYIYYLQQKYLNTTVTITTTITIVISKNKKDNNINVSSSNNLRRQQLYAEFLKLFFHSKKKIQ